MRKGGGVRSFVCGTYDSRHLIFHLFNFSVHALPGSLQRSAQMIGARMRGSGPVLPLKGRRGCSTLPIRQPQVLLLLCVCILRSAHAHREMRAPRATTHSGGFRHLRVVRPHLAHHTLKAWHLLLRKPRPRRAVRAPIPRTRSGVDIALACQMDEQ